MITIYGPEHHGIDDFTVYLVSDFDRRVTLCTICISNVTDIMYTSVAKCHPGDKWDQSIGDRLAIRRIYELFKHSYRSADAQRLFKWFRKEQWKQSHEQCPTCAGSGRCKCWVGYDTHGCMNCQYDPDYVCPNCRGTGFIFSGE